MRVYFEGGLSLDVTAEESRNDGDAVQRMVERLLRVRDDAAGDEPCGPALGVAVRGSVPVGGGEESVLVRLGELRAAGQ
jgi:hypothetical protein